MTKIVWNGCDNYVEAEEASRLGHNFDGETLFHGSQSFKAFEANEINLNELPLDEDGEPISDGVLGSESGKFYRV